MPGIASAATSVVIGHVAGGTTTIRVGAGGIMLPNHAPLVIAEQFGTLAALYPGRIDLGVGRAPGTDQRTALALRRTLQGDIDNFPQDVLELIAYLDDPQPGQPVRAIPGAGQQVPVWILGSSLYGAQLAAALGLPYAFASHFAPEQLDPGAGALPRAIPAVALSRQALCDAGAECGRGRQRRRGQASLHLAAAGLRQSAHRPARAVAAAGRRHRRPILADPRIGAMLESVLAVAPGGIARNREGRRRSLHRPPPARRTDGDGRRSSTTQRANAPTRFSAAL